MLLSPIHCCDVTKPPYLLNGELCTSPLHSNRLYMYTVCCRRGGQCFSVLRTRHTDVVGDSSKRSYVTEQGHNVPLLCTLALGYNLKTANFYDTGYRTGSHGVINVSFPEVNMLKNSSTLAVSDPINLYIHFFLKTAPGKLIL